MRWFELLEKVDWVDSSLELPVTESQELLLGTELGDVKGLGTVLDSELGIPALGDTGLGTALGTTLGIALGHVVDLCTELGESPGFGTVLGEPTLLGDRDLGK